MTTGRWTVMALTACLAGGIVCAGEAPPYPGYNRLVVPRTARKITIDGVIDAKGEWADAAVVSGLNRYASQLEILPDEQRTWFYLTYDDANLYVAMHSRNFPPGSQLKADTQERDAGSIVMLDHYELQWTRTDDPNAALKKHFYKIMANHRGGLHDMKPQPSVGQDGLDWDAGAVSVNRVTDAFWEMEIAIPFKNMDEAFAPEDLETWIMWLVRAYNCQSTDFFMWGGKDWMGWDVMPRLTFSSALPAVRLERLGEPLAGKLDALLAVVNPGGTRRPVHVEVRVTDNDQEVFRGEQTVEVPAGGRKEIAIQKDDLPVTADHNTRLTITGWVEAEPTAAGRRAKAPVAAGPVVLYQQQVSLMPKNEAYVRANFEHVKTYREQKLDYVWNAAYSYSTGTLRGRLSLDMDGLEEKYTRGAKWQVRLVAAGTRQAAFERTVDIKDRVGIVEAVVHPKLADGDWLVESVLLDSAGRPIDTRSYEMRLQKPVWEGCRAGIDDALVPPPYEPVKAEGAKLSVLNRVITLDAAGLPASITSEGEELLAAPLRLEATAGGKTAAAAGKGVEWGERKPGKAAWTGRAELAGLAVKVAGCLEYDGMMFVDLTLDPQGKEVALDALDLVCEPGGVVNMYKSFRGSAYYGGGDWIPPNAQGVLWDSAKTRPIPGLKGSFNPALYVGNPDRGLWWFAESDEGWVLDDARSASTLERDAGGRVRVHQWFVNRPATIARPRTIRFMLQPVPAKPFPKGWREIAWGPQLVWGGSWADGFYTFGFDTPEQWQVFSKWEWASRVLYTGTCWIGPAVPGFRTYAGEWLGDSNFGKLLRSGYRVGDVSTNVWRNAAGMVVPDPDGTRNAMYVTVSMTPSMVDCRSYYYEQGVKHGKVRGYWWDGYSIWPSFQPELGFGYVRDDGYRQPGFNYRTMREMYRRQYHIAAQNNVEPLNWHYADGMFSSFLHGVWLTEGYFYMFAKGVDLIAGAPRELWPMVSGRHLGSIPQMRANFYELELDRAFADLRPTRAGLTVCLLNDFGGYGMNDTYRNTLLAAMRKDGFFDPEVRSWRHWEPLMQQMARFVPEEPGSDVRVSFYRLPGEKLLVALGNLAETGAHGTLALKPRPVLGESLDFSGAWAVRDLETGAKPYLHPQKPDAVELGKVWVGGHDFRLLVLERK